MNGEERHRSSESTRILLKSHDKLIRFLGRMLSRREDAEDIAQVAYFKVYLKYPGKDSDEARKLLFKVAKHLAIAHLRSNQYQRQVVQYTQDLHEIPDNLSRPDRQATSGQAMQCLTEAIEALPPSLKTVFVMRFIQDSRRQDIADSLGLTVGAVEQRLTKAFDFCRSRLTAMGIDEPNGIE